ncbi:MAG: C1 family peptidase [Flavobacteriales bacterium]|nr:C1 family peptidase [Flavobacteriales bacterium]
MPPKIPNGLMACSRPGRSLRWGCLLLASIPLATMAQIFTSGNLIPEPGSVPEFPLETDFQLPSHYELKDSVDNSRWFPPPGNQHRQASCTTWSLCYAAMSYWWNRADGRTYSPLDTADASTTYSPAYLFNLLKQEVCDPCSTGVNFKDIVRLATAHGICTWEQMPYDTALNACQEPVTLRARGSAAISFRPELMDIEKTDLHQWKYHLDLGRPIIAEIVTDSTFFYGGYATNGDSMLHWHYTGDENLLYGHAVVCTGYSGDSLFTFINSYGTHWGGHGYFTATWDMLIRRCTDAHVLMNDTSGTLELLPPEHSEQQASSGQVVHARLKPGQALPVGHTLVRLAGLGRSQRSAVVRSFELGNKNLLHTFHMRPAQAYTVYGNGKRTDYAYRRASFLGRWFKRPVRLTVTTTDAAMDAYLVRRDALLRKLHEGLR